MITHTRSLLAVLMITTLVLSPFANATSLDQLDSATEETYPTIDGDSINATTAELQQPTLPTHTESTIAARQNNSMADPIAVPQVDDIESTLAQLNADAEARDILVRDMAQRLQRPSTLIDLRSVAESSPYQSVNRGELASTDFAADRDRENARLLAEGDSTTNAVQAQPEQQKRSFAWLWLIVLAAGAFFLYRRFSAKKSVPAGNSPFGGLPSGTQGGPFGHQSASNPSANMGGGSGTNIFGQSVGGAGAAIPAHAAPFQGGDTLPDGTSKAAFLRQARASFLHMQSMNASGHVEELRRYFTPEMYEHIRAEVLSNQDTAEFPQLNAQVVERATEGSQYVASVLYSGLVSESLDAPAVPFSETWHFVKAIQGGEWLVAGIQQN